MDEWMNEELDNYSRSKMYACNTSCTMYMSVDTMGRFPFEFGEYHGIRVPHFSTIQSSLVRLESLVADFQCLIFPTNRMIPINIMWSSTLKALLLNYHCISILYIIIIIITTTIMMIIMIISIIIVIIINYLLLLL